MLNRDERSRWISETNTYLHAHSPSVETMMSEVLETLRVIDLHHDAELQQLENSSTDDALKNDITGKLVAKHRERRKPYVELLAELRKHQHSPALVA
jgi:hypothetical protein